MAHNDTPARILNTAERLFVAHGFGGASIRQITEDTGVNIAAVKYHFGSKERLLASVVARLIGPLTEERQQQLRELVARSEPPQVEELVGAFVEPLVSMRHASGKEPIARLLGDIFKGDHGMLRRVLPDQVLEMQRQFLAAFAATLPDLAEAESAWRLQSMIGVLVFYELGYLTEASRRSGEIDASEEVEMLTHFLIGGWQAPAVLRAPSGRRRLAPASVHEQA